MRARFADEYVKDLNATRAAIRAGYSPRSAGVLGHQLLKNPNVRAAVDARLAKRSAAATMDAQEVLERLARIARASMGDYMTWGAAVTGHHLLRNPNVRAAVDARLASRSAKATMDAEEVLERLARIARATG